MLPKLPSIAYPGLPLAPTTTHTAGPGTHTFDGQIISSLSGRPSILPAPDKSSKPQITVPRIRPSPTHGPIPSSNITNSNTLPKVGNTVLARVQRVRVRQVDVAILCVGDVDVSSSIISNPPPTARDEETTTAAITTAKMMEWHVNADAWPATVRREDIRATEKDKVVCSEGFRVGDIVRASVISLGDQANFYLTTARNDWGVLMARSEAGNTMVPISWREFRDPVTGLREGRKVAKPF